MTSKQSGNVLLWIILGVVAIGLAVVIIWRYFAASDALDNAQQAEQTSQQPGASNKDIIIASLPEGWEVQSGSDTVVSVTQTKPAGTLACFVQVEKTTDAKAKLSEASTYAEKLYAARVESAAAQKGYMVTELGADDIMINVVEQPTITVSSHHAKWSAQGPDGVSATVYQRTGYIVRDGYYFSITQSCPDDDFATSAANKALSAFAISL